MGYELEQSSAMNRDTLNIEGGKPCDETSQEYIQSGQDTKPEL